MVPENLIWAFYSASHYAKMATEAEIIDIPIPNDIYYKDTKGRWVKVTAVYDCIDVARKAYRYNDAKYLGAVQVNTKVEVKRGDVWPKPETISQRIDIDRRIDRRRRLSSKAGVPGTIAVKKTYSRFHDYFDKNHCH